ncbi:hypothetical protein [Amycolatopsis nalaikhensis]|uniref:Uncharacterized protein n=1 Tax=Amycolatopsis nalaikhensis TaxID=715472 RepID=A0ABY8Y0F5_9PSEU|nr:hypothetical protein [Amycolatopsis sp. 2-2]WIV61137.1 hypothetical protein QP939_22305 [Amycolatopsis sp. 2-2]
MPDPRAAAEGCGLAAEAPRRAGAEWRREPVAGALAPAHAGLGAAGSSARAR